MLVWDQPEVSFQYDPDELTWCSPNQAKAHKKLKCHKVFIWRTYSIDFKFSRFMASKQSQIFEPEVFGINNEQQEQIFY